MFITCFCPQTDEVYLEFAPAPNEAVPIAGTAWKALPARSLNRQRRLLDTFWPRRQVPILRNGTMVGTATVTYSNIIGQEVDPNNVFIGPPLPPAANDALRQNPFGGDQLLVEYWYQFSA